MRAVERAGYRPGEDFVFAIDAATSEWWSEEGYRLPKRGKRMSAQDLVGEWIRLCGKYPIRSDRGRSRGGGLGRMEGTDAGVGARVQLVATTCSSRM